MKNIDELTDDEWMKLQDKIVSAQEQSTDRPFDALQLMTESRKLSDFRIDELHLYMKFMSFTGKIGEIVKIEKYNKDVTSDRCPNMLIHIKWEGVEEPSIIDYEGGAEIEYIGENLNHYPNNPLYKKIFQETA